MDRSYHINNRLQRPIWDSSPGDFSTTEEMETSSKRSTFSYGTVIFNKSMRLPTQPLASDDIIVYPNDNNFPSDYEMPGVRQSMLNYDEGSTSTRNTPTTLGWLPNTDLIKLYDFVIIQGREPRFELRPELTATWQTPQTVYLDQPTNPKKGVYLCQFPSACGKRFTRPADIERHYRNMHAPRDVKDIFQCDYINCARSKLGYHFSRKDHYRDHLRDYHKEDLGCAKGKYKNPMRWGEDQGIWLEEHCIKSNWWRCSKCLVMVDKGRDGWECASCKLPCEPERKERRIKLAGEDSKPVPNRFESNFPTEYNVICTSCDSTGWIQNYTTRGPCDRCPVGHHVALMTRNEAPSYTSSYETSYPNYNQTSQISY